MICKRGLPLQGGYTVAQHWKVVRAQARVSYTNAGGLELSIISTRFDFKVNLLNDIIFLIFNHNTLNNRLGLLYYLILKGYTLEMRHKLNTYTFLLKPIWT